ncbi:hypothetical protein MtrunA17_Chr1g0199181 [Medicago truncatula]|uniref:DUF3783 domain protein n=1 Tax=Medicago truncatula TaxID=3880 RepID=A0A072VNA0_MEDTR|nr:uncharacterized protein LOC25484922 isoform X2 [Medicago truncatula]KEH43479.1 DUF3783 domain protein [Medicago truncatula]RHN81447.1 hypothetical protein MtrunA17_Chr1g0199181 [Medicago truncatula]
MMMSFGLGISTNCSWLRCHARMPPSCSMFSHVSMSSSPSSCSTFNSKSNNKLNWTPIRASSEGLPNELVEDSKFVPINVEDPRYGPPALLLLGFEADEHFKIQQFLKELEGEFLKVIYCTKDMLTHSLWDVMHTTQESLEEVKIDKSLPRICFLSGLSGEETMMFVDAFPETGLKPAAFAALVPNSANKPLYELIEEITGDHEMLTGEQL